MSAQISQASGNSGADHTSTPIRQNTAPSDTQEPKPRARNHRNLTLPSPISPAVQHHRYQSLSRGAADFPAPAPPPLVVNQQIPSTTPGAPLSTCLPGTPLYPTNPLPQASTSPSASSRPVVSTKGKLKSLLPRTHHEAHSYFHAKIEIQQLASVPFVRGEFGVRWKFKDSVGVGEVKGSGKSGSHDEHRDEVGGLLGKMKARGHNKGKGKDDHGASEFGLNHAKVNGSSPSLVSAVPQGSTQHSNSIGGYSSTDSYPSRTNTMSTSGSSSASITTNGTNKTKVAHSGNLSRNFFSQPNTSPASTSPNNHGVNNYLFSTASSKAGEDSVLFSPNQPQSFSSNAALLHSGSPNPDGFVSPGLTGALSPTGTITPSNAAAAQAFGVPEGSYMSPPRGITPYHPLKEHSITFSYPLTAILKFDISRGTSSQQGKVKPNLQANEFKLVVMQRVIPDDPDGVPQNPRLGAVYLNLAEYVGKGKVERRYLLKESRVNATLKISVEMTHVSGNTDFIAPPLPKAEIMGGIEGFLKQNDSLYMARPQDIYAYGSSGNNEDEAELLGRSGADGLEDEATLDEERIKLGWEDGKTWNGMQDRSTHQTPDKDPYALPSESESERGDGPASAAAHARRNFLKTLNNPQPIPQRRNAQVQQLRQLKQEIRRAIRKEERKQRFHLELESNPYAIPPSSDTSEGEADGDTESDNFESANEDDDAPEQEGSDNATATEESSPEQPQLNHHHHVELTTFDVKRLPLAYGPKTTEALIDALFNPVITTDKDRDSPFTVYIDPQEMDVMGEEKRQRLLAQFGGPQATPNKQPPHVVPLQMGDRSFSMTSTTTSESSCSVHDDAALGKLKSPGEATIVGVPPQYAAGAGLGIHGLPAGTDHHDATAGKKREKGGRVGTMFHTYYKNRKEKIKEGRRKTRRSTMTDSTSASESDGHGLYQYTQSETTTNVFGSPVYFQEPAGMDNDTQGFAPIRRHGTAVSGRGRVVTNKSSSASLSSLSLNSRSGHGHGGAMPPVPPLIPGSVSVAAGSTPFSGSPSAKTSAILTGPPSRPLTRQGTAASNDLSVPSGRMDKTGFVKGGGGTAGISSSFNRWWKGFGAAPAETTREEPVAASN